MSWKNDTNVKEFILLGLSTIPYIAVGVWVFGFLSSVFQVMVTRIVDICGRNKINHFMCELPELLLLGCRNVAVIKSMIFVFGIIILIIPISFIIITFIKIIRAIFKISTSEGRKKAISTCVSHIIVVTLFYGTAMAAYMKPQSESSADEDKFIGIFYAIVTPLLNPLVYTLRNKEVKSALKFR
ncbi:putative olfactory receptor 2B8 [Hyperolius riggenbachi]|uniref:putative olfactory receptor 2B8 n=1 Tax=Hyperolius riggenbachi TaxID=752182 RepID=UPI0035A28AB0